MVFKSLQWVISKRVVSLVILKRTKGYSDNLYINYYYDEFTKNTKVCKDKCCLVSKVYYGKKTCDFPGCTGCSCPKPKEINETHFVLNSNFTLEGLKEVLFYDLELLSSEVKENDIINNEHKEEIIVDFLKGVFGEFPSFESSLRLQGMNEQLEKVVQFFSQLSNVIVPASVPQKRITLFNCRGINDDKRGMNRCLLCLPCSKKKEPLRNGCTLDNLIRKFFLVRSHKCEDWYELYTGATFDNNEITLEFDHGS